MRAGTIGALLVLGACAEAAPERPAATRAPATLPEELRISGDLTEEGARKLAYLIAGGALPVAAELVSVQRISGTAGD